jgi:putative oxidoreductase
MEMNMETGLLVVRMVVGLLLIGRGGQKLFGWFRGGGLAPAAWFFGSVGYRSPRLMAKLAAGAELIGGPALAVGLGTPVAAGAVVATMLNATVAVHRRNDLLAIDGGYAYPLGIAAAAATLGFTGAGAASLDATVGLNHPSVESGFLVLVLGLGAGFGVLFTRAAGGSEARPVANLSSMERHAKPVRSTGGPDAELFHILDGARFRGLRLSGDAHPHDHRPGAV